MHFRSSLAALLLALTVAPPKVCAVSPFVGELTGTLRVTAGRNRGLRGTIYLFVGDSGTVGAAVTFKGGSGGCFRGVANLTAGKVTLTPLSKQLGGHVKISVRLKARGSSVTGRGTFVNNNRKPSKRFSGVITIGGREDITSNSVGVYLGGLNISAGPDSPNSWPIQLFVANDGTAGGDTFDPQGNGFAFQGTVDLTSGAFALPVIAGKESLAGITGNVVGNFVTPSLANGSFTLSNGDRGTVSFPKVAP